MQRNLKRPAEQRKALSSQQSAVSQSLFTAKDAEPPHQAKTGLDGAPVARRKTRADAD